MKATQKAISSRGRRAFDLLLGRMRKLIRASRKTVVRQVNTAHLLTNFEIGRMIVEHEQQGKRRAGYSEETLMQLARRLTAEFGRGYSRSNLEYMRKFYLLCREHLPAGPVPRKSQTLSGKSPPLQDLQHNGVLLAFSDPEKSQTLSGKSQVTQSPPFGDRETPTSADMELLVRLSWSHYVFLMGIDNEEERRFYEIEAANGNWSLRELRRQHSSALYERLALSRDKAKIRELGCKGQLVAQPEDVIKDPYVLEFIGLEERPAYTESDLEAAIIDKLEHFMLELGKGFLFEARQKRLTFGDEHYRVDLVFYNRLLRCYVLIDLKIGRLTHQDLGQMQMYVNYFDRYVKTPEENKTVGILLCRNKNDAIVEITLPKEDGRIFARKYQLYLPSRAQLKTQIKSVVIEERKET